MRRWWSTTQGGACRVAAVVLALSGTLAVLDAGPARANSVPEPRGPARATTPPTPKAPAPTLPPPQGTPTGGLLSGRWAPEARARVGLLALQRSGGGDAEVHLAGGVRGGLPVYTRGPWVLSGSAGYLLGRSAGGTEAVEVRTLYHLLDLRVEAGAELGGLVRGLDLQPYLCVGGLLVGTQAHLKAFDSEERAFGLSLGGLYGGGLRSRRDRLVLTVEVLGLRRQGGKHDLVAEFGVGFLF